MRLFNLLITAMIISISTLTYANDEVVKNKGVEITAEQLKNKEARQALINHDAKAKEAHQAAVSTLGEKNVDEMYNVSAEILPILFKDKTPEQVISLLQEAQANPKKFYESLPADTQKKIRDLASKASEKSVPSKISP